MRLIGFLALSLLSLAAGVLMLESLNGGRPVIGDSTLSSMLDGLLQFLGGFGSYLGGSGGN